MSNKDMPASAPVSRRWSVQGSLRNSMAVLLTVVGLARVVGFYSGLFPLSVLGAQFGASPLPLVFSQVHGVETYDRRFAIELLMSGGRRVSLPGGAEFARRLHGPFTRVKLNVDAVAFADLVSERRHRALLRNMFCHGGRIARELAVQGPVEVVIVKLWSSTEPQASLRTFEVSCGA